ncbi:MAG: ABC transporter permease [Pseudomonadaceae bacterium]|nr:ABC transporter permease [Pseudomonadaceae bacterium]
MNWHRLGLTLCIAIVAVGVLAPWLAPYPPNALHLNDVLAAPSSAYWLGTDALGRDVFSRLVYGTRVSLAVGLVAVSIAVGLGTLVGALAALSPKLDAPLMRFTDIMLCFPAIFLILAVIAILQPSLMNVMIVIGLTGWMGTARLVRAELLSLRSRPFIHAATMAGVSKRGLLIRHLLPNALPPILTSASLGLAAAILTEAGLSYLGLGVQPPTASWGAMLSEGKSVMEAAWWLITFPGLAIVTTVLAFTFTAER